MRPVGAERRSPSISVFCQRRTENLCRPGRRTASFAKTCFTGSTSSNCTCRRCATAATTSCCSQSTSSKKHGAMPTPCRTSRSACCLPLSRQRRELENLLERAVTLVPDGRSPSRPEPAAAAGRRTVDSVRPLGDLGGQIQDVERQAIIEALEKTRYNKTAAAKLLGLSFRQLRYRIKKAGHRMIDPIFQ